MKARLYALYFCLVLCVAPCSAQTALPTLQPRVDPRVEVLSIIFRLAGNPEYNMSPLRRYTADIDQYFAPYRSHPAVLFARKLARSKGVSFDAVMAMAVHLSPPPELAPLVPFSSSVPESRWGEQDGRQFASLARQFYKDTHFDRFLNQHKALYDTAVTRFAGVLTQLDQSWFARFYGVSSVPEFNVALGLNNGGGNYGPRVTYPDGHQEFYAIIGAWTTDTNGMPTYSADYLPTVIHEFNHSFVNPAVDRHWNLFGGLEGVYGAVTQQMRAQAYGNPKTMVYESLVRAGVILYLEGKGQPERSVGQLIRTERNGGFLWMDELCALLREYEAHRAEYPTMDDFMPRIAEFFHSVSQRMPQELARYKQAFVHVSVVRPMGNRTSGVDPGLKAVEIEFDRPLDPAHGYSINLGDGGREHYPITGTPQFLEGGRSIRLPVSLKPHWSYSFVLTPLAFASAEGDPLEAYTVSFHTK